MQNKIVWVDIPVIDLDRALNFYSKILAIEITKQRYQNIEFGLTPHGHDVVAGCLIYDPKHKLSPNVNILMSMDE